ncbi:MAG: hypothetical protein ACRYG8_34180 [Janthinobacterium lividum]
MLTGPRAIDLAADRSDAAGTEAGSAALPTVAVPRVERAPLTAETRRLYATDWRAFVLWCRQHRQTPMPATPETVVAYLTSQADRHKPPALGALSRCVAAIADRHRHAGHATPTTDDAVRAALRAARQAGLSPRTRVASRLARVVSLSVV